MIKSDITLLSNRNKYKQPYRIKTKVLTTTITDKVDPVH